MTKVSSNLTGTHPGGPKIARTHLFEHEKDASAIAKLMDWYNSTQASAKKVATTTVQVGSSSPGFVVIAPDGSIIVHDSPFIGVIKTKDGYRIENKGVTRLTLPTYALSGEVLISPGAGIVLTPFAGGFEISAPSAASAGKFSAYRFGPDEPAMQRVVWDSTDGTDGSVHAFAAPFDLTMGEIYVVLVGDADRVIPEQLTVSGSLFSFVSGWYPIAGTVVTLICMPAIGYAQEYRYGPSEIGAFQCVWDSTDGTDGSVHAFAAPFDPPDGYEIQVFAGSSRLIAPEQIAIAGSVATFVSGWYPIAGTVVRVIMAPPVKEIAFFAPGSVELRYGPDELGSFQKVWDSTTGADGSVHSFDLPSIPVAGTWEELLAGDGSLVSPEQWSRTGTTIALVSGHYPIAGTLMRWRGKL